MKNSCRKCKYNIQPEWFFCPNCGIALKEKPVSISIFKQIFIYFVSFFLAPLGLIWGLKYIRYTDKKAKIIGIISVLLTIISIVSMILVFKGFMDQYSKVLNNLYQYPIK